MAERTIAAVAAEHARKWTNSNPDEHSPTSFADARKSDYLRSDNFCYWLFSDGSMMSQSKDDGTFYVVRSRIEKRNVNAIMAWKREQNGP